MFIRATDRRCRNTSCFSIKTIFQFNSIRSNIYTHPLTSSLVLTFSGLLNSWARKQWALVIASARIRKCLSISIFVWCRLCFDGIFNFAARAKSGATYCGFRPAKNGKCCNWCDRKEYCTQSQAFYAFEWDQQKQHRAGHLSTALCCSSLNAHA